MNMVTKSGSNDLHGQAAVYYLTAATQAGVKQPMFQGFRSNDCVISQPAGIHRLPSINQLNLRVSREFGVSDRWRLTPTVDFFNVTNSQTTIAEVTEFTPPNGGIYLKPSLAINPFVTRFGLRFTF